MPGKRRSTSTRLLSRPSPVWILRRKRGLALMSVIDPKQTSPLRMRSTEVAAWPKGNNLVAGVVPNVGASQPWNPGPLTPVTGNFFFVHSEIGFVRGDSAATTKHDARHPSDFGVTGNVK